MEKKMLELQNSMPSMILHSLDERLPKGYIKMQGNRENVEEIKIESRIIIIHHFKIHIIEVSILH
jgi:hypothetical protein